MELDRIVTSSGRISSTYLLIHAGSAGGSSGNLGVQEPMQGLMKEQVLILKKEKSGDVPPGPSLPLALVGAVQLA